jgi:type IV pilus assembly protein PilC
MAVNNELFYHNLSTMLDAGLPITRALTVAAQGSSRGMSVTITKVLKTIQEGKTLTEAMQRFPKVFDRLDVQAIEAAENSGSLPQVLKILTEWHNLKKTIKGKLISGLLFPAVILFFAALVIPLPYYILGQLSMYGYIRQSIFIMSIFYVPALIIYLIIAFTPRTGPLRYVLDAVSLFIPVLGNALEHLALSRYCYSFYVLLSAGVPITDCTRIATQTTTNLVIADRLKGAELCVQQGRDVSEGFKGPLPAGFVDIWKTGEESGQLDSCAKRLADTNSETAVFYLQIFAYWFPRLVYGLIGLMMIYYIFKGYGLLNSSMR